MGRVDRNWINSGGRLFSLGRQFYWWASLHKSHTTRMDDYPGSYLNRTWHPRDKSAPDSQ